MNSRVNKFLLVLLSLIALSIFILPFSWVFIVGDDENQGHWKKLYLIEDWISLMFYLPFVILWGVYLMRAKTLNFGIFKFFLVTTAFLVFAVSILSVVMLGQDYEPSWGILLALFIFPLLIAFLVTRNILLKSK